jgi:type II secretory ATPase GspE/PulE/Tfp pilus assembly ATPase PilB-like protein
MRAIVLFFVVVLAAAFCAAPAIAQDAAPAEGAAAESAAPSIWPEYDLNPSGQGTAHTMQRGPGGYLSPVKIILTWLLFAGWVVTTDWVSRDCREMRLNYGMWNAIVFFTFFAALMLLLLLPSFALGFTLLVLAYLGSLGAYIYVRNASVEPHQKVLTKDHLRHVFASKAGKVGMKVDTEKKYDYEKGAPVELKAQGGATDVDNNANLLTARQSPGFVTAKDLIADAISRRGDAIMLDYTKEAVGIRYQIDGVWHQGEPRDRESGDLMLAVLKTLAALDAKDRRGKQQGTFGAEFSGTKYTCRLATQGTQTGERAVLKLDDGGSQFHSLDELGMRDKVREQLIAALDAEEGGFVLFCSMPGGGLTTMIDVSLEEIDRLMRNFVAIEPVKAREKDIENVEVRTYDAAAGETPDKVLPKIIREYPDAIVCRDLVNAETVDILSDQIEENRIVIGGIRAKDASEALLRVLMLKVSAKKFAPAATAVANVRLIRKLCESCRVAYEPTPEVLKKLGIPAGRIQALYREPKPEEIEKPCEKCGGLGYHGRTGIYEFLPVNDKVREVMIKQPKLDLLKKAAKLAGARSLQEEGILLVAKGVTSIPELMRVLKT